MSQHSYLQPQQSPLNPYAGLELFTGLNNNYLQPQQTPTAGFSNVQDLLGRETSPALVVDPAMDTGGGGMNFGMQDGINTLGIISSLSNLFDGRKNAKLGRQALGLQMQGLTAGFNNNANAQNANLFDEQNAYANQRATSARLGGTVDPNALSPEDYMSRFGASTIG